MAIIGATQPDELGGRMFQTDDGQELYFFGQEAEALAADLARQPDLRTAQAAPPVDFGGVADFERQWAPQAPAAPPQQMRRDVPMMQKRAEVPVPPETPSLQGPMPPQAPVAPAQPEMVTLPGSAGVDPRRLIERGVMVPTGETVSEAQPVDPELQQVRQAISVEEQEFRRRQAEQESMKQYAQGLQASALLPELEMRAAESQHAARQVEQLYEQERADIGAMLDEHRSRKVDPNRYASNKTAWGGAMTGLSVILGALGSGISSIHGQPTENVALEQMNREIERDIALQQEEIDREGVNARNALALLQHRFGDVQQAKDALKLAMSDVADMKAKELMYELGTQEALQAYQAWQIAHAKEREKTERDIRNASVGKHSTQFKFTQPVSPSAARQVRFEDLPLDQQLKLREKQAKLATAEATIRGGGVDPDVTAKETASANAAARTEQTKSVQELGKSLTDTEGSQSAYNEVLKAAGLRYNADTQQIEGYEDPKTGEAIDIPGVGLGDQYVPQLFLGPRGKVVRQSLDNAVDLVIRARTGAAVQPFEKKNYLNMILGAGTEQEFINGMQILQRDINNVRDMHRARFGQPANRQLDQNRADVERARTQKAQAKQRERY